MLDVARVARLEIVVEHNGRASARLHESLRAGDVMKVVAELERLAACVGKPSCAGDCGQCGAERVSAASTAR